MVSESCIRASVYQYDRNLGWQRGPVQRLQVSLVAQPEPWFDIEELDCDSPQPNATCSRVQANNPLASDHLLLRLRPRAGASLPPMPALRVDRAAP